MFMFSFGYVHINSLQCLTFWSFFSDSGQSDKDEELEEGEIESEGEKTVV